MAEPGLALCSMATSPSASAAGRATSPSASAAGSFAISVQTFERGRHLFLGADAEGGARKANVLLGAGLHRVGAQRRRAHRPRR